jgi:transcriptional regulator
MYVPTLFEEKRVDVLHDLIRSHPLGTLVTLNEQGLQANHIPFLVESTPEPFGSLCAHVARANPVWREFPQQKEVLAIFQGPQSYISPSWYPTKAETGMVVPTWNYTIVHAYGKLEPIEDRAWLKAFVSRLTNVHEAGNPNPWSVSDAPDEYIEKQLSAIVGLKMTITRLVGKSKLSQNRPEVDRTSVIRALWEKGAESAANLADAMKKAMR